LLAPLLRQTHDNDRSQFFINHRHSVSPIQQKQFLATGKMTTSSVLFATTTMSRFLAKQRFLLGRKALFSRNIIFPLAIFVYLLCFISFMVGVNHMNHQQPALLQQSDQLRLGYHEQSTTTRALFQSDGSNDATASSSFSGGELQNIHERPVAKPAPVFLAIPTVPRAQNADYLLRVLQSLENAKFPLSQTYVFYNGNPQLKEHVRWNEGETLFSSKGVHFLWNNVPVPPPHPAAYDNSLPLPPQVDKALFILEARNDTVSRKDWRRKECNDFRVISQYMLHVVQESTDVPDQDNAWIIFNQDDAQWMVEFYFIYERLHAEPFNTTRFDISRKGLVSVAFRAKFLAEIVRGAALWCDFVPVDWMVWSYEDAQHGTAKVSIQDNWVKHIGKVSTREGVVSDPPKPVEEKDKKKGKGKKEPIKKVWNK
jgi:hypothetical protein